MADIVITKRDYTDESNSAINTVAPLVIIEINTETEVACQSSRLNLSLIDSSNFLEISIEGKNIYRYTKGDTYSGGAIADAKAMYNQVLSIII